MDNKKLGVILIAVSLIFIASIVIFKVQINNLTDALMIETGGTCIQDGKCLHEQSDIPIYIGVGIVFITLALGFYCGTGTQRKYF